MTLIKDEETKDDGDGKPTRRGSFIIAPLPISSPALGTGIVPVLGYIFTLTQKPHAFAGLRGRSGWTRHKQRVVALLRMLTSQLLRS